MTGTPAASPPVLLGRPDRPADLHTCSLDELVADEARLRSLLPATVLGFPEAELRLRARRLREARIALARRQAAVGPRPELQLAAEQAVHAARDAASIADDGVRAARTAAHQLLLLGNVIGVVMIVACVFAMTAGVSPLSTTLGVVLMASAGGPIGAVIGGVRGIQAAQRRRAEARAVWTAALERAGVETMGDLAAARLRHDDWRERCQAAQVAADREQHAAEAWLEAVGPGIDPSAVGPLAAVLRQLRAINVELLRRRIGGLAVARSGLEIREVPVAVVESHASPEADSGGADAEAGRPAEVDAARLLEVISGGVATTAQDRLPRRPRNRRPRRSAAHPSIAGVAMRDAMGAPGVAPGPAAARPTPRTDATTIERDGAEPASRVLDLLERVRGKGLHLWTGD